jgi:hypothetical protein
MGIQEHRLKYVLPIKVKIEDEKWFRPLSEMELTPHNNVYNSYPGASSFWLSSRKPKRPLLIRGYIQDLCVIV